MTSPSVCTVALFVVLPCLTAAEPDRIAPLLRDRLRAPGGGQAVVAIRVRLRPDADAGEVRSALAAASAAGVRAIPEIRRVEAQVPADRLEGLSRSPGIEWIEGSPPVDLDRDENDGLREAIGLDILAPLPVYLDGRGVNVGVWETGHPDTDSLGGDYPGHDDLWGHVRVMESSEVTAHATGIAGVLVGSGLSSSACGGQPLQWRGVAPAATILSYSVADSDTEAAELLDAIGRYGIDVSLQTWGESVTGDRCSILGDYDMRAAEFDAVIAGDDPATAGEGRVPVVFSAGNYQDLLDCTAPGGGSLLFPGFRTINPPHTAKDAIAVGAVESDTLAMTDFSSWGPTDDGRIKPDLVAPGAEEGGDAGIRTTALQPVDGYRVFTGTSFAAAATAGTLAALMGERKARGAPALPPAAWKAILVESAIDLTDDPIQIAGGEGSSIPAFRGPDYYYGFGLVWAPAALSLSQAAARLLEGRAGDGDELRFPLARTGDDTAIRVTLAWDDPAGDPALPRSLVNDLDLRVEEEFPSGEVEVHLPWLLDPQRPDVPAARGVDHANNVEQVEFEGSASNHLTVVVIGSSVSTGKQRFWVAAPPGTSFVPPRPLKFLRGDADSTGEVDLTDAIAILDFLFHGETIGCREAADANRDGAVDITDAITLLTYLFLGFTPAGQPVNGCEVRTDAGMCEVPAGCR